MDGIARLRNSLNILEIKIWSWLLYFNYFNLDSDNEFNISISNLSKQLNYDERLITKGLTNLVSAILKWSNYTDDNKILNKELIPLLSYCKFQDDKVYFKFNSSLTDKLKTHDDYIKINMLIQNQFNSKYSKIIYGLCLSHYNTKEEATVLDLSVQQLRMYLELKDNEYPEFKEISRAIIKKSIEEINDKSNLYIEIEYLKNKQSIASIKLKISINKSNLMDFPSLSNRGLEQVKDNILASKELENLFKRYKITPEIITNKIAELSKDISHKDISNYMFYIKDILQNDKSRDQSKFLSTLHQKQNIESFLQSTSAKSMIKNETGNSKLKLLYKSHQIISVIEYFKDKRLFFYSLLDKYSDNIAIKIFRHSLYDDELLNNFTIAEILLPEVQNLPDYNFISSEEWMNDYSNSNELYNRR